MPQVPRLPVVVPCAYRIVRPCYGSGRSCKGRSCHGQGQEAAQGRKRLYKRLDGWMEEGRKSKSRTESGAKSARQRRERDLEQFVPAGQMRSENRRLRSESVFEERSEKESERAS